MKKEENNKTLNHSSRCRLFDQNVLKHFKEQFELKIISTPNQIALENWWGWELSKASWAWLVSGLLLTENLWESFIKERLPLWALLLKFQYCEMFLFFPCIQTMGFSFQLPGLTALPSPNEHPKSDYPAFDVWCFLPHTWEAIM